MQTPLSMEMNPTDKHRHEMLKSALTQAGRPEDYSYILEMLNPPPDITGYAQHGKLKGVKVGILGGGLAGMAAAFELRKLGAEITIFDTSEHRIGGRVYTYYFDPEGRYYGEAGALRIPISHETTWHYINLFGLNTLSLNTPYRNNFLYVHNSRLRSTDSLQKYLYPKYNLTPKERSTPWPELLNYANQHLLRSLTPQVRAELLQTLPEYSPEIISLMNISLRKNYELLGLSQEAINLISGAEPFLGSQLNISYGEIAGAQYSQDFLNIYRIANGNVNLPLAFYNSFLEDYPSEYRNIPRSKLGTVEYKPGHTVTGIYQSDYRNKIVLRYRKANEYKVNAEIYDYVICAIPFSRLRLIEIKPYFSNIKMQAIKEMNYIDAVKALFLCNRRFWERNTDYGRILGGTSFTDLPIQSIFYPGDHISCLSEGTCSPEEPGVLIASYSIGQSATRLGGLDKQRQYELVRQNVEEVHGLPRGFLNTIVDNYKSVHWNSEQDFLGALALVLPGQTQLFSYASQQPEYNNRVFFAGEHISNKHGWIQGALYSGKAAANQLAKV